MFRNCLQRIRQCFRRTDDKFTKLSLDLDEQLCDRSLLNIPMHYWKWFRRTAYAHVLLAITLFIYGVMCFCLGLDYSVAYSRVNCSDGSSVWPPIINIIASVSGLVALRSLFLHWPPFIHLVFIVISIPFVLLTAIDTALQVPIWEDTPEVYHPRFPTHPSGRSPPPRPHKTRDSNSGEHFPPGDNSSEEILPQWKQKFVDIDMGLCAVACMNLFALIILLLYYIKWWCLLPRRRATA